MEQASVVLFWFALALYIGATVLYAYQFVLKRSKVGWWARFLTGAGFICQTLSIGAHSIADRRHAAHRRQPAHARVVGARAPVLRRWSTSSRSRSTARSSFRSRCCSWSPSQIMGGLIGPAELTAAQAMQLDSWRVAFHVALIVFANAGFAFGAVSSALYLYQEGKLKSHTLQHRHAPAAVARHAADGRAPLDRVRVPGLHRRPAARASSARSRTDVGGWWFDPRIMMSGLVWLIFGIYLVLVYRAATSRAGPRRGSRSSASSSS